jgi:hypothetical protein
MLVAAMFLLFVFALSLSIAAPLITRSIQRDREVETMERGKQYQRAIQLYFRKFNSYPPSIDALVKTNNIRFLRKKYINPMTGKSDWKPIMFGQNKAPLAMGFFGEPMAAGATALAGTGPAGNNAAPNPGGGGVMTGTSGLGGSSFFGGTGFGSATTPTTPTTGTTGTTGTSTTGTGQTGATGTTTSGTGTSSTPGSSTGSLSTPTSGQSFGGAGVVGVSPPLEKQSILYYKKKQKYSEWEFTYSPISDQIKQMGGNAGTVGQPASGLTRPSGSAPSSGMPSGMPSSNPTGTPQPQR